MNTFKVGDRVEVMKTYHAAKIGMSGTVVVERESSEERFGIEFLGFSGHTLSGMCPEGNGYWVPEECLILINKNKTPMKKVSIFMKKLLDGDTQKLVKAGLINGDLMPTAEGLSELDAILFMANKPALVTRAEEIIAEAETN